MFTKYCSSTPSNNYITYIKIQFCLLASPDNINDVLYRRQFILINISNRVIIILNLYIDNVNLKSDTCVLVRFMRRWYLKSEKYTQLNCGAPLHFFSDKYFCNAKIATMRTLIYHCSHPSRSWKFI